ncbi:MAG: hypothetical protein JW772_03835 [Candidatus Diapherotrites archaeon]|nr:hypothetical protein [Candidatus Diapherotrites archaeon]
MKDIILVPIGAIVIGIVFLAFFLPSALIVHDSHKEELKPNTVANATVADVVYQISMDDLEEILGYGSIPRECESPESKKKYGNGSPIVEDTKADNSISQGQIIGSIPANNTCNPENTPTDNKNNPIAEPVSGTASQSAVMDSIEEERLLQTGSANYW